MRLDFNILWIDDQPAAVQAQRERLDRLFRSNGFRLRVEFAASVEEAMKYLAHDIYTDHVDLILIDYDLGAGPKGDEGLALIRELLPHREMVFYSAAANDLRAKVNAAKIEGVYCSTRAELPDKTQGVFENLVKKVVDIDHARGIVMGATSDIDHVVNDCLLAAFNGGNETSQAKVLEDIKTRMKEIRSRFEKDAATVEAAKHVSDLADAHAVYTSIDRLNLLRKMLHGSELHIEATERMKEYATTAIPKRNLLAHVRVKVEGFSRKLIHKDGSELSSEEMKALRLELLEYQDTFERLYSALVPSQPA